jgi:hypothetical protein
MQDLPLEMQILLRPQSTHVAVTSAGPHREGIQGSQRAARLPHWLFVSPREVLASAEKAQQIGYDENQ